LLYVVIMAIATVIGFVAGWVGWGMEMIAAGIVVCARMAARVAALFWRGVVVPLLLLVAAGAKWVWQYSRLGSTRLAQAIQAGARWVAERVKTGLVSAGNKIRASAILVPARTQESFLWCGARIRNGSLWTAAQAKAGASQTAAWTKAGANRAAEHGKQAVRLSGARARQGALWTAARTKGGAAWSARQISNSSRAAWEHAVLPGMKRTASGEREVRERIKSQGVKFAGSARASVVSFAAWSAKLPGLAWKILLIPAAFVLGRANAVKDVVIDARKRHAEASVAAKAARKEAGIEAPNRAETERETSGEAEKAVDAAPTAAKEQKPPAMTWKTLLIPAAFVLDRANAAKDVLIDARKRHAEASRAAEAARKEIADKASKQAEIEKAADAEPPSAEEQEPHAKSKKKKKAKEKQDSVEA
jgi:hypothetical protein